MNLKERLGVVTAYQDQEPEPLTQTSGEGAMVPPVDVASGLGGGGSDEGYPSGSASEGDQPQQGPRFWEVYGTGADGGPTLEEQLAPKPSLLKRAARLVPHRRPKAPVEVALQRYKKAQAAGVR